MKPIILLFMWVCFIITTNCKCPIYSCISSSDSCFKMQKIIPESEIVADSYLDITLSACSVGSFCPTQLDDQEGVVVIKCQQIPIILKHYAGQSCEKNSDCFEGLVCISNICKERYNDSNSCFSSDNCELGKSCILNNSNKRTCEVQKSEGQGCSDDQECENNMGCNFGKCVKYFSLRLNEKIKSDRNVFSFCETGEQYNNICIETKLINEECNEKEPYCMYEVNGDPTNIIKIAERCSCGFNKEQKMYCEKGSSHPDKKQYIEFQKEILQNSQNCHASERISCKSSYNYKYDDYGVSDKLNYYQYLALYSHLFKNSEDCVSSTYFPGLKKIEDDTPELKKCPAFRCDSENVLPNGTCVQKDQKSTVPTFLLKECDQGTSCIVNLSEIFEDTAGFSSATCDKVEKVIPTDIESNPFGSPCSKDNECLSNKCIDSKCGGVDYGKECASHNQCNPSLACISNICLKQKYEKDSCNTEFDCRNNLGCHNGLCVAYFSLSVGEKINTSTLINRFPEDLCEYQYIDPDTSECSRLIYHSEVPDSNNLVECDNNSKCVYQNHKNKTVEKYCICGFGPNGKGYCPYSHNDAISFDKYLYQVRVNRNNGCQTLRRFDCELVPPKFSKIEKVFKSKTAILPLLEAAEVCTQKLFFDWVLSSKILTISFLILIANLLII